MPRKGGYTPKEKAQHLDLEERQRSELDLAHQGLDAEEIAQVFGISRRTVDRDFKRALELYQQQRKDLAELVYDDHLRALEAKILELHTAMYLNDQGMQVPSAQGQPTIQNYAIYERWFKAMQERAKLLNLYPQADEHQRSQVTLNQYYLSFDSNSAPPQDYVPGTATPMLPDADND